MFVGQRGLPAVEVDRIGDVRWELRVNDLPERHAGAGDTNHVRRGRGRPDPYSAEVLANPRVRLAEFDRIDLERPGIAGRVMRLVQEANPPDRSGFDVRSDRLGDLEEGRQLTLDDLEVERSFGVEVVTGRDAAEGEDQSDAPFGRDREVGQQRLRTARPTVGLHRPGHPPVGQVLVRRVHRTPRDRRAVTEGHRRSQQDTHQSEDRQTDGRPSSSTPVRGFHLPPS